MSHDQKPGKVRVVASDVATPQRRLGDPAPDAANAVQVPLAEVAGPGDNAGTPRKSKLLLPLLFVSGCAIGGTALPLVQAL